MGRASAEFSGVEVRCLPLVLGTKRDCNANEYGYSLRPYFFCAVNSITERRGRRETAMKIDKEFEELIPPLTEKEFKRLEASILEEGCRDALVLWNDTLVDGHNRYRVCDKHGIAFKTVQRDFADRNAVKLWMLSNQLGRRNLNDFQRIEMVRKCEDAVKAQAKERQRGGQGGILLRIKLSEANSEIQNDVANNEGKAAPNPKLSKGKTTEELGAMAGVSHSTYEHAAAVLDNAPETIIKAVRTGDMSINKAYQYVKRAEKEAQREEARQRNTEKIKTISSPLEAQGLFQTIVIDPAWDYSEEGDNDAFGRIKPSYQTMPMKEIEALPIARISDENCHLYIWVTNRTLQKAFRLVEMWGFRYITCLTWIKPHFGVGNYYRSQTEHVLFGVKGQQPLKRHDVGTWFEAPCGQHSEKPDEFYKLVETCSFAPYIDIFGRKEREGWTVWGENA